MRRHDKPRIESPIFYRYVALIGLTLGLASAQAADTSLQARNLINEMSRASRELNYDATFVYHKDNQMDVMRLMHKADGDREIERLISLTGYAREVIRDGTSVTCIFPDDQTVMVEKTRPRKFLSGQLPEPIEKIAEYYEFAVVGTDHVLGRETWIVNIIPEDDYRYGYQLWIDKESKLSLKTQLKSLSGVTLEQILFTQLEIMDHMPDSMLKPAASGAGYTWYNHTYDKTGSSSRRAVWSVNWLPGGFAMSDHEQQIIAVSEMPVYHLVYSDGLSTVSVFIEKISTQPMVQPGPTHMGGVNAFATIADDYQITAVGEVPLITVEKMARSVRQN